MDLVKHARRQLALLPADRIRAPRPRPDVLAGALEQTPLAELDGKQ